MDDPESPAPNNPSDTQPVGFKLHPHQLELIKTMRKQGRFVVVSYPSASTSVNLEGVIEKVKAK